MKTEKDILAKLKEIDDYATKAKFAAEEFCREFEYMENDDYFEEVNELQNAERNAEDVLEDWRDSGVLNSMLEYLSKH